jgi:hypothetical protein
MPAVGDRVAGAIVGPDGLRLIRAARATMASRREPLRNLPQAA